MRKLSLRTILRGMATHLNLAFNAIISLCVSTLRFPVSFVTQCGTPTDHDSRNCLSLTSDPRAAVPLRD